MKAKLVRESLNESYTQEYESVETTVDQFLTWFEGDENWADDEQTTNTMTIDGEHAQDDGRDGLASLEWLRSYKDEIILVDTNEDDQGTFDLSFELKGKVVEIQSMSPATYVK